MGRFQHSLPLLPRLAQGSDGSQGQPSVYKQWWLLEGTAQLSPEQQPCAADRHHEGPHSACPTGPGHTLPHWLDRCEAQRCRVRQRFSLYIQAGGQRDGEETQALPGPWPGSSSPLPRSPGAQEGSV